MIVLRRLADTDADLMVEWMADPEVTGKMILGRTTPTRQRALEFIRASWTDDVNQHFAIVDDVDDEYRGTVSLKNINRVDGNAEYAIALRKSSWGKDYARVGTELVLDHGFRELALHKIYLNVASSNVRANRFYEKMGFQREGVFREHIRVGDQLDDLTWYSVFNPERVTS